MMDDTQNTRMYCRKARGNRAGVVSRAVVHDDDLKALGKRWQGGKRLVDKRLKVLCLVMAREED
jgi:hypothetical protein